MMESQELTPKQKQELDRAEEQTRPGRFFIPDVDIYETEDVVWLQADMPGVDEDRISIELNDDVLDIMGEVSTAEYEGLAPIHTEYNVGNFVRRFTLPDGGRFDRNAISASIANGVLELKIPKAAAAKPRRIDVKSAS